MTDEEAEARALIDRLQPGELLAADYDNDSYYYARLIEGPSGRGKIIERCYIGDSAPGGVFDRISRELEARTERGELAYGPYCSHWQLPTESDQLAPSSSEAMRTALTAVESMQGDEPQDAPTSH